jgi:LAO/AO transport system kinase
MSASVGAYLDGILSGNTRMIARAISEVENATPVGMALLPQLRARPGRSSVIGITGAPGAGKSTLVGALISEFLGRDLRVGVIAIDPTSPVSGGAILGDRVRMERHTGTKGVFIRSLASRGHSGGLARAAVRVVDILDAAGFDRIIIETVGTGQGDVEAAEVAGTLVVVCPPGLGDEIQAIKAGILEVADIYAITKADLPTAQRAESDIRSMIAMRKVAAWEPPVVAVAAPHGRGIGELVDAIERHLQWNTSHKRVAARERMQKLIARDAAELVRRRLAVMETEAIGAVCDAVLRGELGEGEAAEQALALIVTAL